MCALFNWSEIKACWTVDGSHVVIIIFSLQWNVNISNQFEMFRMISHKFLLSPLRKLSLRILCPYCVQQKNCLHCCNVIEVETLFWTVKRNSNDHRCCCACMCVCVSQVIFLLNMHRERGSQSKTIICVEIFYSTIEKYHQSWLHLNNIKTSNSRSCKQVCSLQCKYIAATQYCRRRVPICTMQCIHFSLCHRHNLSRDEKKEEIEATTTKFNL